MVISVNFRELKLFQEYMDQEDRILDRLENALNVQYQQAQVNPAGNPVFFQQQLNFVERERERVQWRREALENALDILSSAKFSFEEKLLDAKQWQHRLD